jgi:hypothetical protein
MNTGYRIKKIPDLINGINFGQVRRYHVLPKSVLA